MKFNSMCVFFMWIENYVSSISAVDEFFGLHLFQVRFWFFKIELKKTSAHDEEHTHTHTLLTHWIVCNITLLIRYMYIEFLMMKIALHK